MDCKMSISTFKRSKSSLQEDNYLTIPQTLQYFFRLELALPLNIRKRFKQEQTGCKLCQGKEENVEYFLLNCPAMEDVRQWSLNLQQPYKENKKMLCNFF